MGTKRTPQGFRAGLVTNLGSRDHPAPRKSISLIQGVYEFA